MPSPAKVTMRRGYSSGDLGRRPKVATNVTVLVFANRIVSLLSGRCVLRARGLGSDGNSVRRGIRVLRHGAGGAVDDVRAVEGRDDGGGRARGGGAERDPRAWWRVMAACLNILGLVLGILGSLLYSPGFDKWATDGKLDRT